MGAPFHNDFVYRLIVAADWEAARAAGFVAASEHDRRDGYVHLSTRSQTPETARRYYGEVADLLALEISARSLGANLKYELAPSRGEHFPHLYADLLVTAVSRVIEMRRQPDGSFAFGDEEGAR